MNGAGIYDYIVVGAGSAGCVLANRLAAIRAIGCSCSRPAASDNWIWFHIPVGYLYAIGNPRADWLFKTEAEPGLNGRSIAYPRGKVIGGSSAINGMIYMRGQAARLRRLAPARAAPAGAGTTCCPISCRHEDHHGGACDLHGAGGEWRVERPRISWRILDAVRDAGVEIGIPKVDDFNRGDNEGSDYFEVNQRRGRRWSAAAGFLKPIVGRPNLHVVDHAHAERILFNRRRAVGLRYFRDGATHEAQARGEVLLAAGAIGSPQLMELSGVGRPDDLGDDRRPRRASRFPALAKTCRTICNCERSSASQARARSTSIIARPFKRAMIGLDYALRRRGPMTMAPSQLGMFARSSPDYATANLEFHVQPLSLDRFGEPLHGFPAITISVCNLRPSSRGSTHASTPDPRASPSIRPNYLSMIEDRRVACDSIRLARRLAAAPALARYSPRELMPGPEASARTIS